MPIRISNKALLAAALTTFMASIAIAASPFKNLDEVAAQLNIATYAQATAKKTVKIAIFDNGFRDRDKEIGKTLPASTVYHAGPVPVDAKGEESHGLFMAQIVSGLLAKTKVSYELHLFSAFGYSNLKSAIETVTKEGFDIVLYSQVWEYGGNGDGQGFINALVSNALGQATQSGLVWINAAGNFGDATYRTQVSKTEDDWAYLPSLNHGVRIRCFDNTTKKCNLRAVLSWNDFKNDSNEGTDKDLDLVLSDDTLKIIRTGGLSQVKVIPPQGAAGLSLYPREIIEAELKPGIYELRVKIRSTNFTKQDELRLVTSGDYLEQLDKSPKAETLLAPADNSSVITIGAGDSEKSSESLSLGKPEVSFNSRLVLKNGDAFKGTSNSAAMAAALAVISKALDPAANRASIISFLNGNRLPVSPDTGSNTGSSSPSDLTLSDLEFQPTGAGCFRFAALPVTPSALRGVLSTGAVVVETSAGIKIMTGADPFTMNLGPSRKQANDMLVVNEKGFSRKPRSAQAQLPFGAYEIVQKPKNTQYCAL